MLNFWLALFDNYFGFLATLIYYFRDTSPLLSMIGISVVKAIENSDMIPLRKLKLPARHRRDSCLYTESYSVYWIFDTTSCMTISSILEEEAL